MPAKDKAYRYIISKVICPYYKESTVTCIYCFGFLDNTTLAMNFGDTGDRKHYQLDYCRKNWKQCPRAKMLDTVYNSN